MRFPAQPLVGVGTLSWPALLTLRKVAPCTISFLGAVPCRLLFADSVAEERAGELEVHTQPGHSAIVAAAVGGLPPPSARGLAG